MKVYLTGVNTIKNPKKNSTDSSHLKQKFQEIQKENDEIKEENLSLESDKKQNINQSNN